VRLHRHTSAERVRAWPPEVQVGHVASELSRAAALLDAGGRDEARMALLRARELLGVLETCPLLPAEWGAELVEAVRRLALDRLDDTDAAAWRDLQARLMALIGAQAPR
jgi:hypothetical protein